MSRASRLTFILCLAWTASLAQIAAENTPVVPLEADCPIGLRATVEKNGNLLAAQRLQVTLTQWPPFGIVASRVIVHGIASVANRPEPSEIVQNLDLNRILDSRLIGSPGSLPGWTSREFFLRSLRPLSSKSLRVACPTLRLARPTQDGMHG
jgi:hypothetical protein